MTGGGGRADAVIIGGGPAGAAVACHLARAGRQVVLLERECGPHHKVCGEFLSIEAQIHLRALGVDPALLGAVPIDLVRLSCGERVATARLPFPARSLSRYRLDEAMLARAASYGVELRRGSNVSSIRPADIGWIADVRSGEPVAGRTAILANGKHELRGFARPRGPGDDLIGFKMHFRLSPAQRMRLAGHVEIFLFDGGYGGIEPVEDDRANLCLLIAKSRFERLGRRWEDLLQFLGDRSEQVRQLLLGAEACWERPLTIAAVPYGFVHADGPDAPGDLFRLGDQLAVIPSFSGDGMAIALHTAALAAHHVLDRQSSARDYHRKARRLLLPQVRHASRIASLAESAFGQAAIVTACRLLPALMRHAAFRTRIRSMIGPHGLRAAEATAPVVQ